MSIEQTAAQKAIAILSSINAEYKIILADGSEFGTLVAETKKKKALRRPRGTALAYFRPYIENIQVGQRAEVPYGDYNPEELRSPIAAYCHRTWGSSTFITSLNHEKQSVEIIRYA